MLLTEEQVKLILPLNKDYKEWTKLLNEFLPKYDINTDIRVAMFLAQTSHESSQYRVLKENLNYSAQGLRTTFGKYFPNNVIAEQYARKPEKIANRVYANRMGNSNEASGDGWKHAGLGLIQLTGKSNQSAFATRVKMKLDDAIAYMKTKSGALESSCCFWEEHQLNSFADAKDIRGSTKRINGGLIGIISREEEYNRISAILSRTNML